MNVEDFWKKWKEENTESLTLKIEVIGSGKLAEGAALATVEKCQAFAEAFHAHMQVERGPRCPKCGNLNLEDRSHIRGVIPHIVCLCCKEMFYVKLLADFAQFFGQAEQWIPVTERLPEDDSEVFAAIWWEDKLNPAESHYLIHDCGYYEGGKGSGQKIFADCEGEEFTAEEVAYWIYKKDLASTVPLPSPPKQKG